MVDKKQIMKLLKDNFSYNGKISVDSNGLVSCTGHIRIFKKVNVLPVKFSRVDGNFFCNNIQLSTLEGAPATVGGDFVCSNNRLTSLEHSPTTVVGFFWCNVNKLKTLEHAPTSIGGSFQCDFNQLKTLEHAPASVRGSFSCEFNQLTTLQGAPTSVGGSFMCDHNQLTSLEHAPASVGKSFRCDHNQLTTLKGLPVVTKLVLSYSPTLPLLRCLLAKHVEFHPALENKTIETILNKYAGKGRREMFWCQKELEDAGFPENARW